MGRSLAFLLLALEATAPKLVVRVSPPLSLADLGTGCAPVLLTARIEGPEVEEWYCPRVEWTWPGGTTSATESDCPPFDARHACREPQVGCAGWYRDPEGRIVDRDCPCTIVGYPRVWTRRVCLPPTPTDLPWEVTVALSRGGKTFARERAQVHVR